MLFPLLFLAACAAPGTVATVAPGEYREAVAAGQVNPALAPPGRLNLGPADVDPAAPRPGYTYATDAGPIQVEYFSPDGSAWLWYPGNVRAVRSDYRYLVTQPDDGSPGRVVAVEFLYPATTVDPLGRRGGDWETRFIGDYRMYVASVAQGDVFNLSTGTVPYVRRGCDLPDPMNHRVPGMGRCRD